MFDPEKLRAELERLETVVVPDPFKLSSAGWDVPCVHVAPLLVRLGARTVSVDKRVLRELKFGEDVVGVYHVFNADPQHTRLEMQLKRLGQISAVLAGFFHRYERLTAKLQAAGEDLRLSGVKPDGWEELRREVKLYRVTRDRLLRPLYTAARADEFFRRWARFKKLARKHLRVGDNSLLDVADPLCRKHRMKLEKFLGSEEWRTPQRKKFCLDWED